MSEWRRLALARVTSGVEKIPFTRALRAAFRRRARQAQPFKAAPDHIDPGHQTCVAGVLIVDRLTVQRLAVLAESTCEASPR